MLFMSKVSPAKHTLKSLSRVKNNLLILKKLKEKASFKMGFPGVNDPTVQHLSWTERSAALSRLQQIAFHLFWKYLKFYISFFANI